MQASPFFISLYSIHLTLCKPMTIDILAAFICAEGYLRNRTLRAEVSEEYALLAKIPLENTLSIVTQHSEFASIEVKSVSWLSVTREGFCDIP
jgi:hypothetical protein